MSATNSEAALIAFERVEKRYRNGFQLRVEDLRWHHGDRLLIVGENGSGKSTLTRAGLGAVRVDRGVVRLSPAWRNLRVEYAPQAGGLYSELTVQDNLDFRLRFTRGGQAGPAGRYARLMGLTPALKTRARDLSGGLHRLALLAAALEADPDVLVLDEPFGDLDARGIQAVCDVLIPLLPRLALFVATTPLEGPGFPGTRRIRLVGGVPTWLAS